MKGQDALPQYAEFIAAPSSLQISPAGDGPALLCRDLHLTLLITNPSAQVVRLFGQQDSPGNS